MSGHNKWSKIKHRKAYNNEKKNNCFTKIIKSIVSVSKIGGNDPNNNHKLKQIINYALFKNLPKKIINKAINRNNITNNVYQNIFYISSLNKNIFLIIQTNKKINLIKFNKNICKIIKTNIIVFKHEYKNHHYKKFIYLLFEINNNNQYNILDTLLNFNLEDIFIVKNKLFKIKIKYIYLYSIINFLKINYIDKIKIKLEIIFINNIIVDINFKKKILNIINYLKNINKNIINIFINTKLS